MQINTDSEVNAGSSLIVTGANFPLAQASAIYVGWQDSTSGTVTESDVNWGQAGDPTQSVNHSTQWERRQELVHRLEPDPELDVRLLWSAIRTFSLRRPSAALPRLDDNERPDRVQSVAVPEGQQTNVGSTTLTTTSSFSAPITIPPGQAPGMYNLVAGAGGHSALNHAASSGPAGQPLIPIIQMEDAPPNSPPDPAPLIEGSPFVRSSKAFSREW